MIHKAYLLKIIKYPHLSEKASIILEHCGAVVLKVEKYATKTDIKHALHMLFSVQVDKVNILITSKKSKRLKNKIGYRRDWKKAYVVFKRGSQVDFSTIK